MKKTLKSSRKWYGKTYLGPNFGSSPCHGELSSFLSGEYFSEISPFKRNPVNGLRVLAGLKEIVYPHGARVPYRLPNFKELPEIDPKSDNMPIKIALFELKRGGPARELGKKMGFTPRPHMLASSSGAMWSLAQNSLPEPPHTI